MAAQNKMVVKKPKRREASYTMREIYQAWNLMQAVNHKFIEPWTMGHASLGLRAELRRMTPIGIVTLVSVQSGL